MHLRYVCDVTTIPAKKFYSIFVSWIPGAAIGDCLTDTFSYTSPGNAGSPIICGVNTGQHSKSNPCRKKKKYLVLNHCLTVILDASDVCNTVSFTFGMSSMASREYNIKVTQYECGTNLGGNIQKH